MFTLATTLPPPQYFYRTYSLKLKTNINIFHKDLGEKIYFLIGQRVIHHLPLADISAKNESYFDVLL